MSRTCLKGYLWRDSSSLKRCLWHDSSTGIFSHVINIASQVMSCVTKISLWVMSQTFLDESCHRHPLRDVCDMTHQLVLLVLKYQLKSHVTNVRMRYEWEYVTNENSSRRKMSHEREYRAIKEIDIYIWRSHTTCGRVSYEWVNTTYDVTHMNESCHTWMSHVTHTNMSIPRMNGTCRTYERAMSHIWMSHVTYMNESCHTYECVNTSYEWDMSHIWTSHVTQMNESRHGHRYDWVM